MATWRSSSTVMKERRRTKKKKKNENIWERDSSTELGANTLHLEQIHSEQKCTWSKNALWANTLWAKMNLEQMHFELTHFEQMHKWIPIGRSWYFVGVCNQPANQKTFCCCVYSLRWVGSKRRWMEGEVEKRAKQNISFSIKCTMQMLGQMHNAKCKCGRDATRLFQKLQRFAFAILLQNVIPKTTTKLPIQYM